MDLLEKRKGVTPEIFKAPPSIAYKLPGVPNKYKCSWLNKILFLPGSKLSTFVSSYAIPSSFPIYNPILYQILSLLSFPSSPLLPYLFSFLSFLLSGKFKQFSYLPGSAATTLLRF